MTAYYGTASEFYARYPLLASKITSAEIVDSLLPQASEWLDRKLGGSFTLPFSSNNRTARELTYMKSLHLYRLGTPNPIDSEELRDELTDALEGLLNGAGAMTTDSSQTIFAAPGETLPINEAFGSFSDWPNTFSMDEPENQRVDPNRLRWERERRGLITTTDSI